MTEFDVYQAIQDLRRDLKLDIKQVHDDVIEFAQAQAELSSRLAVVETNYTVFRTEFDGQAGAHCDPEMQKQCKEAIDSIHLWKRLVAGIAAAVTTIAAVMAWFWEHLPSVR